MSKKYREKNMIPWIGIDNVNWLVQLMKIFLLLKFNYLQRGFSVHPSFDEFLVNW
jgi:hypothetical protein